jgi:hypothetical protein
MSYENHTIPDHLVRRGEQPAITIDGHEGEIRMTITPDGNLAVSVFQQDELSENISPTEARKMVDWLVHHYKSNFSPNLPGDEPGHIPRECYVARHPCEDCARKDQNCPVVGPVADYAKSCIHKIVCR